ncbi:MAG: divalent-cation tolerance protein CutA [Terrimicrobiaceae bacterium]|nr:divalent-cation tolerance protein CutA [Terrimicrobiaceae bacterium]
MDVVLTTFASADAAAPVVRQLVEEKLAACGSIVPGVRSIYFWEGQLEDTAEVIVLFKTTCADPLMARLSELHPYDVPEIVRFSAADVAPAYARWVASQCAASDGTASR